jgi:uncharacterized membrane protein YfcA
MLHDVVAAMNPSAAAIVAFAGLVRGFSGFGFSLAAVPLLSGVLPLNAVVPLALVLEAVGILPALRRTWRPTEWRTLGGLLLGAAAALPFGVLALHAVAPSLLRPAAAIAVLSAVAFLWHAPQRAAGHAQVTTSPTTSPWPAILVGGMSGALNGATAMSGPPIILFMLAGLRSPESSRATMMLFFSASAALALVIGIGSRTYILPDPLQILWCLPFLAFGLELGIRAQRLASAAVARRLALGCLALSALASLLSALAAS